MTSINSQRVPPCSARESRLSVPTADSRGKFNQHVREHGPVISKLSNELRQDGPDQSGTVVLIGLVGSGIAATFKFFSFNHDGEIANAR